MAEQKIQFRKIRDFGENLGDTFLFIKSNLRSLLISVLTICAVFMLAQAIFNQINQSRAFGIFDQFRRGFNNDPYRSFNYVFTPEYVLAILCTWFSHIALQVTLAAYIKTYVIGESVAPSVEQIWDVFRRYYLRVLLYSIPIFLLVAIGFIFCIAPGVFLAVVLMPFTMVVVVEESNFGIAFNRCFQLVKDNFWISIAIYIVAAMIYYFCTFAVGAAIGVLVLIMTYLTARSLATAMGILTSILNVFSGILYIIFFVSVSFQYFSLVEKKDATGILQRIDQIGSSGDNVDNAEKQY